MPLESVVFMDCLPTGSVRPDLASRTELVASRDKVDLRLEADYVIIDFRTIVPLSRIVRCKLATARL